MDSPSIIDESSLVSSSEVCNDQHSSDEHTAVETASPVPHLVIRPTRGWATLQLGELWKYRELLYFLAWRDIKVRYKQTVLGIAWAVLVPFMTMVVFNVLFGLLMGRGNEPTLAGVPYAISTFCALVPWQLFASAMSQSSNSIVNSRNLITKVYFPRLIAPLAPVLASLVDFLIAFAMLIAMIGCYHLFTDYTFVVSWRLLTLPFFVMLVCATALAISLWLSAMNAIYRDVRYMLPFLTQLLMFVSPVVYTTESILNKEGIPDWARVVYGLNPLAGVLEGFRWALLGGAPPGAVLIPSTLMVIVLLISGMFYFRRMERTFVDLA